MALLEYRKIIGRAAWVRAKAGYEGAAPPYSTRHIFDTVFKDIAVAGAELPPAITEMAVAEKGRRAVFYNRVVNHSAQRVGLMHGLYHHMTDIRGEEGLRECNVVARKFETTAGERDPVELACDLFAAEILVPLEVLDGMAPTPLWGAGAPPKAVLSDEIDHLSSKFNVPQGFMRWRLFDLHALRNSHFNPLK